MEAARRRGSHRIDMASLRSAGRCERFGALLRRMPRAPLDPHSPHLLCIYSGTAGAGDAGVAEFATQIFRAPIDLSSVDVATTATGAVAVASPTRAIYRRATTPARGRPRRQFSFITRPAASTLVHGAA
ncbi:unnamed protein product [Leptosia nina]|uniref:Uncharacterized protein n=1 Tax=Leptosia nina TaxID=320188 RepID=A0AAV1JMS8_9NEOP